MKGHPAKSLALALVVLAAVASVAAGAGSTKHPTGRDQAVKEGCQRSFINLTLVNSPEWIYVHHDPTIHVATGITRVTHPSNTDQPGSHTTFDFNSNLVVDHKYSYLLAGSPKTKTNNFAGEEGEGEATGRLHYEWEQGAFPQFAWPADGDRTTLWGSWIWDCGHFTQGNTTTGEKTEFHPLNAVAVNRSNPYAARAGESESDFFMSSDGTYAHAQEQCALKLKPLKNMTYGPKFFGCARHHANFQQPLEHSYSFFVPAPPKPAGAGRLLLRTVRQAHSGRVRQSVKVKANGLAVTISPLSKRVKYGVSFFPRWSKKAAAPTQLKVTLQSILVKVADPDGDTSDDKDGIHDVIWFMANNRWQLVNDLAPGLANAHDGQSFPINKTLPIAVQPGKPVTVLATGFECDQPSGLVLVGHFIPVTPPCPATAEAHIASDPNDNLGAIFDQFGSATAALGTHVKSSAATITIPHSGQISLGKSTQGNDAYELTYTVSK